jgi:hypothetical protein
LELCTKTKMVEEQSELKQKHKEQTQQEVPSKPDLQRN